MNTPPSQPNTRGPIGIVAALHEKVSELLTWLSDAQCIRIGSQDFWTGRLDDHAVAVVLSRVSKVATAPTTVVLIMQFNVYVAMLADVAGVLAPGVAVDGVAVSKELLQRNVDASLLFPYWEISLTGMACSPADAALASELPEGTGAVLADPHTLFGSDVMQAFGIAAPQAHRGLIVSRNRFVCTSTESAMLCTALSDALTVEMEDTAVTQVCHEWGVPFAATRTISSRADSAASVDFAQFIAQVDSHYAVAILHKWLLTATGA